MEDVAGVLLAGGQSRRMGGGDKCLLDLGGKTILERVIERINPQVESLVLSANGDISRFDQFGLPIVADAIPGFVGPLAGILAGLQWAKAKEAAYSWIVSIPTDTPFIPDNLVISLKKAAFDFNCDLTCAVSRGRKHPAVGIWPLTLIDQLESALVKEKIRKIDLWTSRYNLVEVKFENQTVDPFFNINNPDDLKEAERLIVPDG